MITVKEAMSIECELRALDVGVYRGPLKRGQAHMYIKNIREILKKVLVPMPDSTYLTTKAEGRRLRQAATNRSEA